MAFVLEDRVVETANNPGQGDFELLGAVENNRTFVAAIGNGNTTRYLAVGAEGWEIGIAEVAAGSPDRLLRPGTVTKNSDGGTTPVNFSGTVTVACVASVEDVFDASLLTSGILPSERLSGPYTGITSIGTQSSSLNMGGNSLDNVSKLTCEEWAANSVVCDGDTIRASTGSPDSARFRVSGRTGTGIFFPSISSVGIAVDSSEIGRFTSGGLEIVSQANALSVAFDGHSIGATCRVSTSATANLGGIRVQGSGTAMRTHMEFHNENGQIGSITASGSSTSYNTSSDQRLKVDLGSFDGALERLSALPVHLSRFKTDAEGDERAMLFAQEMIEHGFGYAVSGPADGQEIVGTITVDGEVVAQNVCQEGLEEYPGGKWDQTGICEKYLVADYSKLVPELIAAVKQLHVITKEQDARIQALEEQLAALQSDD